MLEIKIYLPIFNEAIILSPKPAREIIYALFLSHRGPTLHNTPTICFFGNRGKTRLLFHKTMTTVIHIFQN